MAADRIIGNYCRLITGSVAANQRDDPYLDGHLCVAPVPDYRSLNTTVMDRMMRNHNT